MTLRVDKDIALEYCRQLIPGAAEIFRAFEHDNGWSVFTRKVTDLRTRLKLDNYVVLYADERFIGNAILKGIDPEQSLAEQIRIAEQQDAQYQQQFVNELAAAVLTDDYECLADAFTEDPIRIRQLQEQFDALSEEHKAKSIRSTQYLLIGWMPFMFNLVSVMVHGAKLTTLVPQALQGNDDSFCKAVHIDKNLLHLHPDFSARHRKALDNVASEQAFLDKVNYRLRTPPIKGRIRYHELYALFALLNSLKWLDDLRHREILDLCEQSGMDTWHNRIQDENALTKRLLEYRHYQQSGCVSMH